MGKRKALLPKSAILQNNTGVSKQEQVQVLTRKRTAAASSLTPNSTQQKPIVPSRFHSPVPKQPLSRKGEEQRKSTTATGQKPVVPSRLHPSASKQILSRKGENQQPRKSTSAAGQKPVVSSRLHLSVSEQTLSRKEENQEPRKSTTAAGQKPVVSSRLTLSVSKKPSSRKWEAQEPRNATVASTVTPKSAVQRPMSKPSFNPKDTQSQRLAKSSIHGKKRLRSHDDDDDELNDALSEMRELFGYSPKEYADEIEDCRKMVANFQREEKRSARIAEKELRKLQEKVGNPYRRMPRSGRWNSMLERRMKLWDYYYQMMIRKT